MFWFFVAGWFCHSAAVKIGENYPNQAVVWLVFTLICIWGGVVTG